MAVFPFSHHLFSCPCVDITRIEKLANNRPFDSFRFLSFQILGVVFAICLFRSIGYEKI